MNESRQRAMPLVAVGFPAPWREAQLVYRTIMLFEAATHLAALQDRERARLSPHGAKRGCPSKA